jgi:blue copper oxidase
MKSKIWITSVLISIVILGGCSSNNSDSDENLEHSTMTQEEMKMEDKTEIEIENSHTSHNDPLIFK